MTPDKRKTKGIPDDVDRFVGQKLRTRRTLLGISQEKLAAAVGVTFQQVQKYERGTNRISASRLFGFSKKLDVSVAYFYDGIDNQHLNKSAIGMADNAQEGFSVESLKNKKTLPEDLFTRKETIDLIRTYYSVEDPSLRKDMLKLVKSMAKNLS